MYGLPTSDKSKEFLFFDPVRELTMSYQDRSLGSVELHVSALAKGSSGDPRYRYESTGAKEIIDPIRLDKENASKGHLHYTATFIPALSVKGIKFEGKRSEVVPGHGRGDAGSDSSSISSLDDEVHGIPSGVTIKLAPKATQKDEPKVYVTSKSTDSGQSSQGSQANDIAHTAGTGTSTPHEGVEMSTDELLTHRTSGVSKGQ